jgi:hypothetical protein
MDLLPSYLSKKDSHFLAHPPIVEHSSLRGRQESDQRRVLLGTISQDSGSLIHAIKTCLSEGGV